MAKSKLERPQVRTIADKIGHKMTPEEEARRNEHPLRRQKSQMDHFLSKAAEREAEKELIIERVEEWKDCLNRLASSPDGQHFLRLMIKASNLHTPGAARDTVGAVVDKQRQDFYLRHVRPYLDKSNRAEIE